MSKGFREVLVAGAAAGVTLLDGTSGVARAESIEITANAAVLTEANADNLASQFELSINGVTLSLGQNAIEGCYDAKDQFGNDIYVCDPVPGPVPSNPPTGGGNGGGGSNGGSNGGSSGGSNNGGSNGGSSTPAVTQPQLSFPQILDRDYAEACAGDNGTWVSESPSLFVQLPEGPTAQQQYDEFIADLQNAPENPEVTPEDPRNVNDELSGRVLEVAGCQLDFITREEFVSTYGEASASAYDQHLIDFGFPTTNWEVMIANVALNTTPNNAQFNGYIDAVDGSEANGVFDFVADRFEAAIANTPGLTLENFADGTTQIGLPVTGFRTDS